MGVWIYADVTPVVLDPGETYTIGSIYYSDDNDYYISSASSMSTAPEVTWVASVYPTGGSLGFSFPGLASASNGRLGPNFIFGEVALDRTTWGGIKAIS